MSWEGVGYACKIEENLNGELYEAILEDELIKTLEYYGQDVENVIFQHDNDLKHTCKRVTRWLENQEFKVLDWPAQSPDLNPIEHLWHHLKRKVREYEEPARGVNELWRRTEIEWERISKQKCQDLVETMPRRIAAVIRAKGGYTKYCF